MNTSQDKTRGRAVLDPRTYKRDALVQVWLDRRHIAMLTTWLENNGYRVRFVSEVVKESLEMLVSRLVEQGMTEVVDTAMAQQMLEYKFSKRFNPGGRGEKNLLHNMVLDERRKDPTRVVDMVETRMSPKDEELNRKRELKDEISKRMEQIEYEKIKQSLEEVKKMAKESGRLVEE